MGARGKLSASALSVVQFGVQEVESVPRPKPPADLTPEQAEEWRAVVNRLSADWFPRETLPMLAQYCRHVVAARRVAQIVEQLQGAEEFDLVSYDRALKMQEREGRALSALATRMRISQQATVRAEKARKPAVSRPWREK